MRYLLVALLAVHGSLHLLGLQWGKAVGAVWGVASLSLLMTALLLLVRNDHWWVLGAVALVFSQALIVSAWSAARAGTVINLLLALPVAMGAAQAHFARQSDAAVKRLLARVPAAAPAIVTREELAPLPPPVRRWLEASGVVGRERAQVVRLHQRGEMRTAVDQPWMPAEARQYFSVDVPGFVWTVSVTMKGVPVVGRDTYEDGHGHMSIKAGGLIPVADGRGPEIDQGTLLRFLGEIIWFPSAALAPYIRWTPIDDNSARATMSHGGVTASGVFTFDQQGRAAKMTATRYKGDGKSATLERWEVPSTAWSRLGGVLMPVQGTATWKLGSGDLEYYRWEVTDVAYNRDALRPAGALESPVPVAGAALVARP
jgi:hypothetical protein